MTPRTFTKLTEAGANKSGVQLIPLLRACTDIQVACNFEPAKRFTWDGRGGNENPQSYTPVKASFIFVRDTGNARAEVTLYATSRGVVKGGGASAVLQAAQIAFGPPPAWDGGTPHFDDWQEFFFIDYRRIRTVVAAIRSMMEQIRAHK